MKKEKVNVSRREFLIRSTTVGTGFTMGFYLTGYSDDTVPTIDTKTEAVTSPAPADNVSPVEKSAGRTMKSMSLSGPGKYWNRNASTPARYSRNGTDGSNGRNGSAGVRNMVVAHEAVSRPAAIAIASPGVQLTFRRSNRCRQVT